MLSAEFACDLGLLAFSMTRAATPSVRNRAKSIFVGLALDFCVRFSAEDAVAEGFEAVVLTDATRAIDMDGSLSAALAALKAKGVTLATTA